MLKSAIAVVLGIGGVLLQGPVSTTDTDGQTGSIAGVVSDNAGSPIERASVRTFNSSTRASATTDAQGRYTLSGLPPGEYVVVARREDAAITETRIVTLRPNEHVASVDFRLGNPGTISGRVLDQNSEPLPEQWVLLLAREYHLGVLRYSVAKSAQTDDQGAYRLQGVSPGRAHLLQAKTQTGEIQAISNVPADPELRRPAYVLTYYDNAASLDGATMITLRDGEERQDVDIRMLRSPSYCIEAVLETGGIPGAASFRISPQRPAYGLATFMYQPHGTSGPDGEIRICDLARGEYRITAYQTSPDPALPAYYGATTVAITDADARGITISPPPRLPLKGRMIWNGTPPDEPFQSDVYVTLMMLNGAAIRDLDVQLNVTSSIPGEFSFPGLRVDDYEVQVRGLSDNLYVKDVLYAGTSAQYRPLSLGSAIGEAELRISIGSSGGILKIAVADQHSKPVVNSHVYVIPSDVSSEPELAAKLVSGQTDQYGMHTTRVLVPGEYYLIASPAELDKSPESVGKLWRARSRAEVIELAPNATAQVTIAPVDMN